MSNKRTFFIALIFLAAITACVIPGLPTTATAPTFAPTVDTGFVETTVAETVSAAIVQTEPAQPATTPAPTATPELTAASATPTFETISSNSTLSVQVDASTIFADDRAGYEIVLPAGWLIMRINEPEYLDIFQLAEAADENIQQSLLSVQKEDPNILRLFAIDAQEGHVQNGFVTNIKFVLDEKKSISLETDEALKASASAFAATVPGFEILSAKLSTVNETQIGLIELKFTTKDSSGADVVVFKKQAVFNSTAGQTNITLSTVEALKETLFPVFDAMLGTVKVNAKQ